MRDRLIELIDEAINGEETSTANIAYHLRENGVMVLPCKIGDIVYQTDGVRIYELTILDISLHKNKPYYETDGIDFDDDAIGKSIFLTREEAEQALKGGVKE